VRCFHCGQEIAGDAACELTIDGSVQPMCCAGCEMAARLIIAQGLTRYYQFRTLPGSDAEVTSGAAAVTDWSVFDRERARARYLHTLPDGSAEVSMRVDGLHCAACAWLIENSVKGLDGVLDIQVNADSARAEIRFNPQRLAFSALLQRVQLLGYLPQPLSFTGLEPQMREQRESLKRLALAGLGMMAVMTYTVSLYAGAFQGMADDVRQLMRLVSLVVSTPVVLYAARPFFAGAWRSLRARRPGMDVPVALSIAAAYGDSVWVTLRGGPQVYFDSAVMFTFFLLLGRYIEASLRRRAGASHEALERLLPTGVLRIEEGQPQRVTLDELRVGDRLRILPGERVASDGVILEGRTELDESLLTGELAPRVRTVGDAVTVGTLNIDGVIEVRVTQLGADSTLATVSRMLERARAGKPRLAESADRVASWFVIVVLAVALGAGLYWFRIDASRALPVVLAVLVVTCPCALSLATPAALAAATTRLARAGLLVARASALESLARADVAVLDKTGTLTRGTPRLVAVQVLRSDFTRAQCCSIAAAIESYSNHPVAHAFGSVRAGGGTSEVQIESGSGLRARVAGRYYRIGREDYVLAEAGRTSAPAGSGSAAEGADIRVLLGDAHGLVAQFRLRDALRPGTAEALAQLRSLGVEPQVASGDAPAAVAAAVAHAGGLAYQARLKAGDKVTLVHALQQAGHCVLMVGDGVNDAPVLAAADVSIAIAAGTELAKVNADCVMLGQSLAPLALAVHVARRTRRVIRQNLTWAVLYNACAIPLAATGHLQPWLAALGMSLSSLLVVANASRLLRAGSVETAGRGPAHGARARPARRRPWRNCARIRDAAGLAPERS
jgi:P-type Cu2+ transporter